jgi:[ribosomal protein S5]-alanine N-acetyltransferase
VLVTERLILRPAAAEDEAALRTHWTDPDVRRFLFDGATLTDAEITETIEESTRTFAASGYGLWLIGERDLAADGTRPALVGTAGLRPLEDLGLEIFYSLTRESLGRGYATEAARAVLDHAFGPLGLPEVLAEVDEGNAASAAVLARLGMIPFAVVPGHLGPMTRYRRDIRRTGGGLPRRGLRRRLATGGSGCRC